ncbi:hypothetical protein ABFS82_12G133300 [Erythranthe guttata]|uniref:cylicin-1 n=1 Tax=Erythranthe guttata TaxID=4155 RepID=UPI00064DFD5C|nr:PREDICTED: cylicin-1 [Erythranthe guttata]|eukprot:XP_012848166.1 PREDICTED: cylicin-1 [Erythranthe guttata]
MGEKMRIYIGGLGSSVQDDDLRKTFTSPQLGTVESVEIIRTKDRSFGYLEFVPVSDKGLAKLFSTYNGCLWKGGKLRLEKAKEHYLFRLNREWAEEAETEIKLSTQNVDAVDSVPVLQKPKKDLDIDKSQLNLFFPRLRRIKPIPLKGTGKHKYSFQRVEIPPLPIHFCDCEEHSVPPESAKINPTVTVSHETEVFGVNENELNMMKSILDKLLDRNSSKTVKTVSNQAKVTEEANCDAAYNGQADDIEEDEVSDEDEASDEDNLVINIVGKSSKRVDSLEDWGQKMTAVNQDSFLREPASFSKPIPEVHGNEKTNLLPNKKRKQSVEENNSNNTAPSNKKGRKGVPHDSEDIPVAVKTKSIDSKSGPVELSRDGGSSRKSPWKDLVRDKDSAAFHISDVLMDLNPEVEAEPISDSFNGSDEKGDESSKVMEDDVQSTEPSAGFDENDDKRDESSEVKEDDVQSTEPSAGFDENDDKRDESSDVKEDGQSTEPSAGFDENDDKRDESSGVKVDVQSAKPSAVDEKMARGAAWRQKSSWLQLVADASSSKFSLAQVLPGVTFQTQETQQLDNNDDFFNSKNGGFVHEEDMGKPQGSANKDVYAALENPMASVLTKEQSNSDSKEAVVEEKGEESAPLHLTNNVQSNRALGDTVVSETCPFMRTDASLKKWKKLSGSRNKKGKGQKLARD